MGGVGLKDALFVLIAEACERHHRQERAKEEDGVNQDEATKRDARHVAQDHDRREDGCLS